MGFFKKEGLDVIDYTLLEKKGILKKTQQKSDVLDFTNASSNTASSSSASSPTDFASFFGSPTANPASQASNSIPDSDVNALKIKLDDFEYKLEKLLERLASIESKLSSN